MLDFDDDIEYLSEKKPKENANFNQSKNLANDDDEDDMVLAAIENSASKKTKIPTAVVASNNSFHTPSYYPQAANNMLCNPRLKELKKFESFHTPNGNSPQENTNTNKASTRQSVGSTLSMASPVNNVVKTPLWLKPSDYKHGEQQYSLNIDMENAMEFLKTPDANCNASTRKSKIMSKAGQETPLDELFTSAIHIAVENSKKPSFYNNPYQSPDVVYNYETNEFLKDKLAQLRSKGESNQRFRADDLKMGHDDLRDEPMCDDPMPPTQPIKQQILKNVKVYVCKQFQNEQVEFYDLVEQLGGNFIWTYNSSCTHFIYAGRLSDNNNELHVAKREKKFIVAPSWLYDCQSKNMHVDERLHSIGRFIYKYFNKFSNISGRPKNAETGNLRKS